MSEQLTEIKCCNKPVSIVRNAEHPDNKELIGVGIWCETCETKSFHENENTAIELIKEAITAKEKKEQEEKDSQGQIDFSKDEKGLKPAQNPPKMPKVKTVKPEYKKETKKVNNNNNTALMIAPKNPGELENYFNTNQSHLIEITSPVVGDKSAMERLISNNMRYVQNAKQIEKCWTTPEGQESIIHETEEAMMMGAELGKMGDLVPFGSVCQFIPSVEAFEFALTNGKNAPFESITIECVYKGDDIKSGRTSGNFFIDFSSFGDRLEVEKVAVYGLFRKTGLIEGEIYAADRLLEKAAVHSQPYKNYLKMLMAFEYAKTEGKTTTDENGRESFIYFVIKETEDKYFQQSVDNFRACEKAGELKKDGKGEYAVQTLPKKGGTWEKKTYRFEVEGDKEKKTVYLDDLTNPYAGPDQPEMLRKSAGKSFLGKYAKVRNSEAAMDEVRSHKKIMNTAFNMADDII